MSYALFRSDLRYSHHLNRLRRKYRLILAFGSILAAIEMAGACRGNIFPSFLQEIKTDGASTSDTETRDNTESGSNAGNPNNITDSDVQPVVVPPKPFKILLVGPSAEIDGISKELELLLLADAALETPQVETLAIGNGGTLLHFIYDPNERSSRIERMTNYTHLVLIEAQRTVLQYPAFHFEGICAIGQAVRGKGVKPILLARWPTDTTTLPDAPQGNGTLAYRIGNGCGLPVVPAAYANPNLSSRTTAVRNFLEAASIYSTLSLRDTSALTVTPAGLTPTQVTSIATASDATVKLERTRIHYTTPFAGTIGIYPRSAAFKKDDTFRWMSFGSSTEGQLSNNLTNFARIAGLVPVSVGVASGNGQRSFTATTLVTAQPRFNEAQFDLLVGRNVDLSYDAITTPSGQTRLAIQLFDKHLSSADYSGRELLKSFQGETNMFSQYTKARSFGIMHVPFHLGWARLKTYAPETQLLADGTHLAEIPAALLAAMVLVSATGASLPLDTFNARIKDAVMIGQTIIRELSFLSNTGNFVSDEPTTRPTL